MSCFDPRVQPLSIKFGQRGPNSDDGNPERKQWWLYVEGWQLQSKVDGAFLKLLPQHLFFLWQKSVFNPRCESGSVMASNICDSRLLALLLVGQHVAIKLISG